MERQRNLGCLALACCVCAWLAFGLALACRAWLPIIIESFQANPFATVILVLGLLWSAGLAAALALLLGSLSRQSRAGTAAAIGGVLVLAGLLSWYFWFG